MKILIINPNSDPDMTASIQRAADAFLDRPGSGDCTVTCLSTPGAPRFIETYEDQLRAAPGMIELIRANQTAFDGFVVACHCDPNLDALKEICDKPVVGIGEASMKLASMLGHRFSVISTDRHSIPNKEALVRKYHLEGVLASVRAPGTSLAKASDRKKYLAAARAAIEEDGAEVIVLGCAGMAGLDRWLERELGTPVLDGVICALIVVGGLVRYGVSTSKVRRYRPLEG